MSRNRSKLLIAIIACLCQFFLAGPGGSEVVDRIVAEVNDEIITMSEIQNMAKALEAQTDMKPTGKEDRQVQRKMLDNLINRKLAMVEAKKRGITMSDKEMAEALGTFKQRNNLPNDEALNKALSQAGLTLNEFKQQITEQFIQNRLVIAVVGAKVVVSDADIRKFYEDKFKQRGGVQVHLRVIKLPYAPGATEAQKAQLKAEAENIMKEARQGASFPEIANKLSASQTDLGYVNVSDMDPKLAEHLNRLKPKEVLPVEAQEGFQLIQLVDRRTGQARSFEEAAPEIRNFLMGQEAEKYFEEWVKGLRDKAHIKIML
jgi:peptidyl-prolyl cis-trans isomerase SurA